MSWNVKVFLGEIPGDDFSKYLCHEILSIFWGRFLRTISANIYVVKYKAFSGEIFGRQFQQISMSWNIKNYLGEISGDDFSKYFCCEILNIFWGQFQQIFMSWNLKHYLGEIFGDDFSKCLCCEILSIFGGDVWGQFQQIFMSWNLKHYLGEISGDDFSKCLCREILSIFWGRLLGTILENIYVVKYCQVSIFWGRFLGTISANDYVVEYETFFWRTFLKNIMSWIIKEVSGDISRVDFEEYSCRQIWRMFWGRFSATFCLKLFVLEY